MRGVKRFILILAIFVVVLAILAFVLENQQAVTLSFFGWSSAQWPAAVFVTLALIVGMLIGPIFGALVRYATRRERSSTPLQR
ncbi:lipopolysaccharide assembly protein LapA domain-containing protein [Pseudomonas sp. 1912-s]|uniref:lipopolysaccharide assembly protein LapA domain-containing protein n=1 Tax=Pseudomonas sp. 1912-s TaxID=3033802 RepID=UPI0023DF52A7|nr:lipopolysaccharide assembly protein LapA domain-containing protein [Pseudomonas sp. 1912-s]MDF3197204.1 lipopolysaccharide assembly protein LapA domain-containing protein [Pseudomonas sp. 1912-s]